MQLKTETIRDKMLSTERTSLQISDETSPIIPHGWPKKESVLQKPTLQLLTWKHNWKKLLSELKSLNSSSRLQITDPTRIT